MILGNFCPSIFFKISFYVIVSTILIIYQISQYYHHQLPFPHCWISKVAQHYPEFIFFRFATISGAVTMILGWFTNMFYLQSIAKDQVFNLKKYRPEVGVIIGTIGCFLLMGSTATIDTGIMNNSWHVTCATNFFYVTLVAQIYNTVLGWIVYYHVKTISLGNMIIKTVLFGLIVLQLWISAHYGKVHNMGHLDNQIGNDWDKFIQWTMTATIMTGFYVMALDVQKFKFVYDLNPTSNCQKVRVIQGFA